MTMIVAKKVTLFTLFALLEVCKCKRHRMRNRDVVGGLCGFSAQGGFGNGRNARTWFW